MTKYEAEVCKFYQCILFPRLSARIQDFVLSIAGVALQLLVVVKAISLAIARDGNSGGVIRTVTVIN